MKVNVLQMCVIESESDCVVEHESLSCMKVEDIELK